MGLVHDFRDGPVGDPNWREQAWEFYERLMDSVDENVESTDGRTMTGQVHRIGWQPHGGALAEWSHPDGEPTLVHLRSAQPPAWSLYVTHLPDQVVSAFDELVESQQPCTVQFETRHPRMVTIELYPAVRLRRTEDDPDFFGPAYEGECLWIGGQIRWTNDQGSQSQEIDQYTPRALVATDADTLPVFEPNQNSHD